MATRTAKRNKIVSATQTAGAFTDTPLVEKVFSDGVLVDVNVSFWTAKNRNTAEDLNMEPVQKENIPEFVIGLGTKRLIEHEQVLAWQRIAMKAWGLVERYSFDFPVGRGRFVPAKALPEIETQLEALRLEFNQVVVTFLNQYEALRDEMLAKYPDHRERLQGLYPEKSDLARRFSFSWSVFNVRLPKQMRLQTADRATMARYEKEINTRVESFLEDSIKVLRARVSETCGTLAERIKKGEVISEPSLNKIRKLVEQFRMLNFTGDRGIEQMLEALKSDTLNGRTAEELRDDAAALSGFGSALNTVAQTAGDISDVSTITGEYRRRIIMDTPANGEGE